jgi:uncharacterized membrane protein YraQ (UPF0718 family)
MSCCGETNPPPAPACCGDSPKRRVDWLFWGTLVLVAGLTLLHLLDGSPHGPTHDSPPAPTSAGWPVWLTALAHAVAKLLGTMWWGVAAGMVAIGILGRVPREFVLAVLGPGGTWRGLLRATLGGLLLDLCNHGILLVAARLYQKGASLGQVMAFLIASPWNSFSLTLVLIALIGLPWTLVVLLFSAVVALVSGAIFDGLVRRGLLPGNPNAIELPQGFAFWPEARRGWVGTKMGWSWWLGALGEGIVGSKMVVRWLLLGVLLAGAVEVFVPTDWFAQWFGPSLVGLLLTLLAATALEVCSEGSTPLAAQLFTRANAPGNGFTFLMAGASTDLTEILVLRDVTKSWKIALFLPLITVPQILLLGWLMNFFRA